MNKLLLPANDIATTHALLRRATWGLWYRCERVCATTPALLRRATLMRRHLEGIDLATTRALLRRATPLAVEPLDDALATTHALLRRATTISAKKICVISLQLTLSCGERPQMCALWQALWVLQLTLSCGERLSMVHSSFLCYGATTRALLRRATL